MTRRTERTVSDTVGIAGVITTLVALFGALGPDEIESIIAALGAIVAFVSRFFEHRERV